MGPSFKGIYFIAASILMVVVTVSQFQNCAPVDFQSVDLNSKKDIPAPESPFCDPEKRPPDSESVACLAPDQAKSLALQSYRVICTKEGQWLREAQGPADYSRCPRSCSGAPPSDVENVACPAPNESQKSGVQHFLVTCLPEGVWSRSSSGAPDFSACPRLCDESQRPASTSPVACPAPNSGLMSGVQNYTVICNSNGTWGRSPFGNVDYSLCPQSCDPAKKPPLTSAEKCPNSSDLLATRSYTVTCLANGTWSSVPGGLDTSKCPAPTCDPATKPSSQEVVACSPPYSAQLLAKQNYSVQCSGTTWVKTPTTRDESQCPKACGAAPANDFDLLACQSPFAATLKAKQNYTYRCNSSTGQFDRILSGPVDYGACPKSCTAPNPAVTKEVPCPDGYTGTAYQFYFSTCDTTTGQWTSPVATTKDTALCLPVVCAGTPPSLFDPVACPAPFEDRMDAKKMYSPATCDKGTWVPGLPTGQVDTSACPVNDCTGSVSPGLEKDISACSLGATGRVYQTCSLTCTGRTYTQTNCSSDNYDRCDCGSNANFDLLTKTCIPKAVTCVPGQVQDKAVACGPGYSGGTKFKTLTTTCPAGPYGAPLVTSSVDYNVAACTSCPTKNIENFTPTCGVNQVAVTNSATRTTTYSCETGAAVPTTTETGGTCQAVCPSGSQDVLSEPNNVGTKTTCSFSWNSAIAGQPGVVTRATNGGTLSGLCGADGAWINVVSTCPKPPDVKILSTGSHCDIGGPWGWDRNIRYQICPGTTQPINPSLAGGCPEGWSQFEDKGCYISNTDPRRVAECANSNPADECCVFRCSDSAPPPKWNCYRDTVNIPGGEGGTQEPGSTCTCHDNFSRTTSTTYLVTRPYLCIGWDMDGNCISSLPETGICQDP